MHFWLITQFLILINQQLSTLVEATTMQNYYIILSVIVTNECNFSTSLGLPGNKLLWRACIHMENLIILHIFVFLNVSWYIMSVFLCNFQLISKCTNKLDYQWLIQHYMKWHYLFDKIVLILTFHIKKKYLEP